MTTLTIASPGRKERIIYWLFTTVFFLLDGLLPALTFNSQMAKDGISHLGYPDYFRIELSIGKIIGGLLLILPMVPPRYKEWAYVGFGISLISAFVSNLVVIGHGEGLYMSVFGMVILIISYIYYHKIYKPYKSE